MAANDRFWERKTLDQMSRNEWESLCDGCARCCVVKLQDEDSGDLYFTRAACRMLDLETCRCTDYANRCERVPDCLALGPDRLQLLEWMPASCAYKRLARGQGLPDWHPLISGSASSVIAAGVSVHGQVLSETDLHPEQLVDEVFDWDV